MNQTATWPVFFKQVKALSKANIKSRYRKTFAGFLWVVINPLIMYGVQSQIFSRVLKLGVPNYYLFLLSGLLPWIFLLQSLEMGAPILQFNSELLKSYPTNPLVYLAAQVTDNFVNFLATFFLILVPVSFKEEVLLQGVLLLPIALTLVFLTAVGLVWFLATLQIFFRDTRFILSFVLNVAYFLTPIFYPVEYVPENYRWLINLNPLYLVVRPFRVCIYSFSSSEFLKAMGPACAVAFSSLALGYIYWKVKKNHVYFNL